MFVLRNTALYGPHIYTFLQVLYSPEEQGGGTRGRSPLGKKYTQATLSQELLLAMPVTVTKNCEDRNEQPAWSPPKLLLFKVAILVPS